MKKEEAISYLQQLYPNGGHCWLDDQRMEAIGMAVKALQEEPVSEEQVKEDTMTIRKEWFEHCKKSWYNEGYIDGEYNRDRQFEKPVSEDFEDITQTITYEGEVYTRCYKDKLDAFACKYPMSVPKTSKKYAKYSDVDLTIAVKKGAQWQKEQFEKERLKQCNTLTKEQAQIESDFVVNFIKNNNCTPTFIDAIEYGMKLKLKEENKL